jgi:hypothetical protein
MCSLGAEKACVVFAEASWLVDRQLNRRQIDITKVVDPGKAHFIAPLRRYRDA